MADSESLATFAKEGNHKIVKLKLRRTLKGHLAKVYCMEWNANSRYMVSASQDGKLLVWDALAGNKLEVISLQSSWVMTCAYAPSGNFVACGGLDNICYIYHIKGKDPPVRPIKELSGHTGFVGCVKFIDDKKVITASGDYSCAYWDVETGQVVTEFKDHQGEVMTLSLNPTDNNLFVSAGSDTFVKLWDTRSSKPVQSFKAHEKDINTVCFFPNGNAYGTASDDFTAKLIDVRANKQLMQYSAPDIQCPISSISFTKSGQFAFTGQEDSHYTAWDTLTGEKVYSVSAHNNRVSCVSVTPDGNALCTASWDNELKIWA
eukprot:TRINITY_DN534_c0_g1_i1.p1 TRINITY_DN534_c0_g1~~TRINITY_DN534_c0_g1_i1.p1  ORF type:complete len:348 (-),score=78.20 TRINITY_DN534_c0_g1_i1:64-1017(-)